MSKFENRSILIKGDDDYENEVSRILEKISYSDVGGAVLDSIPENSVIMIAPYTKGDLNATEQGGLLPTGKCSVIRFSPSTFDVVTIVNGVKVPNFENILGMLNAKADDVLLHEMVHSVNRLGAGSSVGRKLTGVMAPYQNEEEFFAILVANTYMSEKGKPPALLRGSHILWDPGLSDWQAVSEVFLFMDDNFRLIERFWKQNKKFAGRVARSRAKFNPLRSYHLMKDAHNPLPSGPLKVELPLEDHDVPQRVTQHIEIPPPLTDALLIEILKPRFHADDVAGYGGRLRRLERLLRTTNRVEAFLLFARFRLRQPADLVSKLFHDHLSTAARSKLLHLLVGRLFAST